MRHMLRVRRARRMLGATVATGFVMSLSVHSKSIEVAPDGIGARHDVADFERNEKLRSETGSSGSLIKLVAEENGSWFCKNFPSYCGNTEEPGGIQHHEEFEVPAGAAHRSMPSRSPDSVDADGGDDAAGKPKQADGAPSDEKHD